MYAYSEKLHRCCMCCVAMMRLWNNSMLNHGQKCTMDRDGEEKIVYRSNYYTPKKK